MKKHNNKFDSKIPSPRKQSKPVSEDFTYVVGSFFNSSPEKPKGSNKTNKSDRKQHKEVMTRQKNLERIEAERQRKELAQSERNRKSEAKRRLKDQEQRNKQIQSDNASWFDGIFQSGKQTESAQFSNHKFANVDDAKAFIKDLFAKEVSIFNLLGGRRLSVNLVFSFVDHFDVYEGTSKNNTVSSGYFDGATNIDNMIKRNQDVFLSKFPDYLTLEQIEQYVYVKGVYVVVRRMK